MELINSLHELKENLATLESYMRSSNTSKVDFHNDLIKKGICFVAYYKNGHYVFAPSKFVGYKSNNMNSHNKGKKAAGEKILDGRITTPVIKLLLNHECIPHDGFEIEYKRFCKKLGITKPYIKERKFWLFVI